ncbi:TetR/AcrR family transcriptional regulator [Microbacterium sp. W1N]|uniref:TetR/AcrR family transcriptional regulator n=1 Tax=Microbacterium festucae TaxID=2977531 RepID=UPI0021BE0573|nr:TetR/AcrR family transcriptional regulator [Microbacterium festucae]MCT9820838.1 TetR/AcrR family transcriptional regulator [Microbacterium festucae]
MPEPQRITRGRPQDEDLTGHILAATLDELMDQGYAALRIERVAAAVGCGKTAIYRRWATKGELVAAAMNHGTTIGAIPDTGSIAEDLVAHARQNAKNQGQHAGNHNPYTAMVAPEVHEILWDGGFLAQRRDMGRTLLARAIEREELPGDTDVDAILDTLAGFVLYRNTIRREPVSEQDLRELAQALTAAPPRRGPSAQ